MMLAMTLASAGMALAAPNGNNGHHFGQASR
jgi:hypothetical protein